MKKHYIRDKKGFTIFESVISISLFLVVFIGLIAAVGVVKRYIRDTSNRLAAIYLCQEKIEDYRNIDYRDIPLGVSGDDFIVETEQVVLDEGQDLESAEDDLQGTRETKIDYWLDETTIIGKKITVVVSWTGRSGEFEQELTTAVANIFYEPEPSGVDCSIYDCAESDGAGGCQPLPAGEYGLPACQRCDGVSLAAVNFAAGVQDVDGINLCNQVCQACDGAGACITVSDTAWGAGEYGCLGSDARCYAGECRDCSDGGGYLYSDGQGSQACWHMSEEGESCDTECASYGECVRANWNDSSGCPVMNNFISCSLCNEDTYSWGPYAYYISGYVCIYRKDWVDQDCSGASPPGSLYPARRFCVCQY